MADSLILTGVKHVKKHTGTEMQLRTPRGGGDSHRIKKWWAETANNAQYVTCTVFDVTVTGTGTVKLILDTNRSTNIRIDHDGAFNFTFFGINEVSRAALFTNSMELIEHYVFPKLSGGRTMTVEPPNPGLRPSAPSPDTTLDTISVTGATAVTQGDSEDYSADVTGDATPYVYAWSVSAGGTITAGQTAATASIEWAADADAAQTVTCTVTSDNADWDTIPLAETVNITVSADGGEFQAPANGGGGSSY